MDGGELGDHAARCARLSTLRNEKNKKTVVKPGSD